MDKQTQLVSDFMSLTGAEFNQAKHFLEAADWNLEQATNLFFESGGVTTSSNTTSQSSDNNTRNTRNTMQDEEDFIRSPIPQTAGRLYDDDFDMNPRYQQQQRQNIDPFEHMQQVQRQMYQQMHQQMQQPQRQGPPSFFQNFGNNIREMFNRVSGTQRTQRAQTPTQQNSLSGTQLGQIFQPPENILFNGSFDALKIEGQKQKKWLLVNIQEPTVFDSIRLNRDTFSNEALQEIMQVYFIFWQVTSDSVQGQRFIGLYNVNTYPYIAVLDPRTGENVKSWQGKFMNAEKLCDELQKFIDKNEHHMADFDELLQNTGDSSTQGNVNTDYAIEDPVEDDEEAYFQPMPRQTHPQQQYPVPTGSRQIPINVDDDDEDVHQSTLRQSDMDLTEDELLQQAIQASIEEAEREKQKEITSSTKESFSSSQKQLQQQQPPSATQSVAPQPAQQPVEESKPIILNTPDMSVNLADYLITSPEQANGKSTTRLRVKHADGKMETVTFLLDTPLAAIYALERSTLPEQDRKVKNIKILFAGKVMDNALDVTLGSAKVTNASLSAIVE